MAAYVDLSEPAGSRFSFKITPTTTILDLKHHVNNETGVPNDLIQIKLRGMDLGDNDNFGLLERLAQLDANLLVPPMQKEFTKKACYDTNAYKYADLDILYDVGGGCLTVYRWRCYWCFIVEFDITNGCTECGICGNKIASRCKDDGCEMDCCCEKCNCECFQGTCNLL